MAITEQPPQTGIIGAIIAFLLADSTIVNIFGQNINPGRVSPVWSSSTSVATNVAAAPYVILTHVAGQYVNTEYEDNGAQTDVFNTIIQAAIFGNGFEQARQYGLIVHNKIRKRYYSVDNYATWLQPLKSHMIISPTRSEVSADIWQSIWQYQLMEPVSVISDGFTVVDGSGTLVLPGPASSGLGAGE